MHQKNQKVIPSPIPYDPSWIIALAKKQIPHEEELIRKLEKCTLPVGYCPCGCGGPYFITSDQWNFGRNVVLTTDTGVDVILDIMKDKRIGFIEVRN